MSDAARVNVVARTTEKQFFWKAGNIFTSERAAKCHAEGQAKECAGHERV